MFCLFVCFVVVVVVVVAVVVFLFSRERGPSFWNYIDKRYFNIRCLFVCLFVCCCCCCFPFFSRKRGPSYRNNIDKKYFNLGCLFVLGHSILPSSMVSISRSVSMSVSESPSVFRPEDSGNAASPIPNVWLILHTLLFGSWLCYRCWL